MIRPGFTITSPLTGSRTIVVESDAETGGRSWLLEVHCLPNTAPDLLEHRHSGWTEQFEIISGVAQFTVERVRGTARAGDSFQVLPNQRHLHPWNAGDGELIYRQRSDFGQVSPATVQEVLGVFATVAGLARANKVDRRGLPRNPPAARRHAHDADAPRQLRRNHPKRGAGFDRGNARTAGSTPRLLRSRQALHPAR